MIDRYHKKRKQVVTKESFMKALSISLDKPQSRRIQHF